MSGSTPPVPPSPTGVLGPPGLLKKLITVSFLALGDNENQSLQSKQSKRNKRPDHTCVALSTTALPHTFARCSTPAAEVSDRQPGINVAADRALNRSLISLPCFRIGSPPINHRSEEH